MNYGEYKLTKISVNDEWRTPSDLLDDIRLCYGPIVLDAAADHENHVAPIYFTQEQDALEQDWTAACRDAGPGVIFCNPPYSKPNKPLFTRKAIEEAEKGEREVVMVLPVNTRDIWMQEAIFKRAAGGRTEYTKLGLRDAFLIYSRNTKIWLIQGAVRFTSPFNPKNNGSPSGTGVISFTA